MENEWLNIVLSRICYQLSYYYHHHYQFIKRSLDFGNMHALCFARNYHVFIKNGGANLPAPV